MYTKVVMLYSLSLLSHSQSQLLDIYPPPSFYLFVVVLFSAIGSRYVVQAGLELIILLSQPPEC
jgi:hypothetical protein